MSVDTFKKAEKEVESYDLNQTEFMWYHLSQMVLPRLSPDADGIEVVLYRIDLLLAKLKDFKAKGHTVLWI